MILVAILLLCSFCNKVVSGILYPRSSETREVLSLDGLWSFTTMNQTYFTSNYRKHLEMSDNIHLMPVPSSYNDLGTDPELRDYVGSVVYQRTFFVPKSWKNQKVWIRFGSVCYSAHIWINKNFAVKHNIGHLPFQEEISSNLLFGLENTITVTVSNVLDETSIPQGKVSKLSSGRMKQVYTFDFFNYAGIDRSVFLYTTPKTYIDDVTVLTDINSNDGIITYAVLVKCAKTVTTKITILDKIGNVVASGTKLKGKLVVKNATFWWPYLMSPNPGYLYSFQVEILTAAGIVDKYTLMIGIRQIWWDNKIVTINNKPLYLRGFGRHEDYDFRGKGLDLPLIIRDYNLIKWIGANAFRTSHYPYAEEIMDLADKMGIMIIDECPAVDIDGYSSELLENHKKSLTELYERDKNRPSVIIWSAANEPRTQYAEAKPYFEQIVNHIKGLDASRPVTIVSNVLAENDYSGQFLDVALCNIYSGWYSEEADLDLVVSEVVNFVTKWHQKHNIPVLVSEYGADTLEGFHKLPAYIWSEEYQEALIRRYFEAFDQLMPFKFLIGEMVWNFADFKTPQSRNRVGGNKKGIFTRNREPKAAAHLIRKRYWTLAQILDDAQAPKDLYEYIYSLKILPLLSSEPGNISLESFTKIIITTATILFFYR